MHENMEKRLRIFVVQFSIFSPACQVRVSRFLMIFNQGATSSLLLHSFTRVPLTESLMFPSQLRMLWATPGPEVPVAECSGPWLDPNTWQIECQNISQIKCQKERQNGCQIECQNRSNVIPFVWHYGS